MSVSIQVGDISIVINDDHIHSYKIEVKDGEVKLNGSVVKSVKCPAESCASRNDRIMELARRRVPITKEMIDWVMYGED